MRTNPPGTKLVPLNEEFSLWKVMQTKKSQMTQWAIETYNV
jgi:hypothetical protein